MLADSGLSQIVEAQHDIDVLGGSRDFDHHAGCLQSGRDCQRKKPARSALRTGVQHRNPA